MLALVPSHRVGERVFTRSEATSLLDRLRPLLEQVRELAGQLADGSRSSSLKALSGGNGGGEAAREVMATGERLRRAIGAVEALGVLLRDPSTGLIDFPARRSDDPIYLCWRLGEEGVDWWHPRDTGLAGRARIDWDA
jgi:hypothetical protein